MTKRIEKFRRKFRSGRVGVFPLNYMKPLIWCCRGLSPGFLYICGTPLHYAHTSCSTRPLLPCRNSLSKEKTTCDPRPSAVLCLQQRTHSIDTIAWTTIIPRRILTETAYRYRRSRTGWCKLRSRSSVRSGYMSMSKSPTPQTNIPRIAPKRLYFAGLFGWRQNRFRWRKGFIRE